MNNSKPPRTKSIVSTILLIVLAVAYLAIKPKLEGWLGMPLPPVANDAQQKHEPKAPIGVDRSETQRTSEPPEAGTAKGNSGSRDTTGQYAQTNVSPNKGQTATKPARLGVLTPRGRNFLSTAGLIYTPGSRDGHRRKHVLKHAKDDQSKPVHGVFDNETTVFALVDEAYQKVKSRSSDVTSRKEGRRMSYVVKMRRRIGFKGGRNGKRDGNPPLTKLKLILEDNEVITAFPY